MTVPAPWPAAGPDLLRQAIDYALASTGLVTPALLACSTPCCAWDLGMLLAHLGESVAALTEGFTDAAICLLPACAPAPAPADAGPADAGPADAGPADAGPDGPSALRASCDRLRAAAAAPPAQAGRPIAIGGHTMPGTLLSYTGAIELAVHGWDIAAACGSPRSLPADLAAPLLAAAPVLIPDSIRPGLFAPPLPPPPCADPGDRLLAFLGRAPLLPPQPSMIAEEPG